MGAGATGEVRPAGEKLVAEVAHSDQSSSSDLDESDWVTVDQEDVITWDDILSFEVRGVEADDAGGDAACTCCGLSNTLDEHAFPLFAPLLNASQAYAARSGFRFRNSDFEDAHDPDEPDAASNAAVMNQLLPVIHKFSERLKSGDAALIEEFGRAYEIVMMESVRNAMAAAFHELNLWPPHPAPDVEQDDCAFQDLSAPMPVVAQRLYNEEILRQEDANSGGGHGLGQRFRQAMTASFLVDFASEIGAVSQLCSKANEHVTMLKDFHRLVEDWEKEKTRGRLEAESVDSSSAIVASPISQPFFDSSKNFALRELKLEALRCWSEPVTETVWMFTSAVFVGAAATAGIMLVRQSKQGKEKLERLVRQQFHKEGEEEVEIRESASCTTIAVPNKDECLACPQQHYFK
mmetsp:Transcript_139766/g.267942  ORF Transcript_139766/g.267942 Transcript_139766/m.267942 type:complete len:406 (-) Transcript_139766:95-1312(-)